MIRLDVGAPTVKRSPGEMERHGQAISRLLDDQAFQTLLTEAADELVALWARETAPSARDVLWGKVQGIQHLLSHAQKVIEQGVRAARSEGPAADTKPSTT